MADYSTRPKLRTLVVESTPSHYFDDFDFEGEDSDASMASLPSAGAVNEQCNGDKPGGDVAHKEPKPPPDDEDDNDSDGSMPSIVGAFKGQTHSDKGKHKDPEAPPPNTNSKHRSVFFWGTRLSGLSGEPKPSAQQSGNATSSSPSSNQDPDSSEGGDGVDDDSDSNMSPDTRPPLPPKPPPRPNNAPDLKQQSKVASGTTRSATAPSHSTDANGPTTAKRTRPTSLFWLLPNSQTGKKTIPGSFSNDISDRDGESSDVDPLRTKTNQFAELAARRRKETQDAAAARRQNGGQTTKLGNGKSKEINGTTGGSTTQESPAPVPESDLALQQDFEHALDELEEAREDRDRLSVEKRRLENEAAVLKQQIREYNDIVTSKDKEKTALRKRVKQLNRVIATEHEQPLVLQDRLDQAHYKLRKAERRNRYVEDTDRWKADAKYRKKQKDAGALLFGFPTYEADEAKNDVLKERRGAQGLTAKSVTEVVSMMHLFNHSVFQNSAQLSKWIELKGARYAAVSTGPLARARKVLGARAVYIVTEELPNITALNPLLTQIILQIFLVFWCNSIIEAWYPKQATFAEFLVDICSKIKVGANHNVCGTKTMITQNHDRDSLNLFGEWVQEMIDDLQEILSAFGWVISGYQADALGRRGPADVHNTLIALVKEAYDLRTAMAEVSTSGDVDLAIISYDTHFDSARMEDEFEDQRKVKKGAALDKSDSDSDDSSDDDDGISGSAVQKTRHIVERVVGTTGIGLQREVVKPYAGGLMKRDIEMVLKPRVVLEQSLLEAFDV